MDGRCSATSFDPTVRIQVVWMEALGRAGGKEIYSRRVQHNELSGKMLPFVLPYFTGITASRSYYLTYMHST
jgi:hypothetical protein